MKRNLNRDQILSEVRHVIQQFEEDTEFKEFSSETDAETTVMLFRSSGTKESHLLKNDKIQDETLRLAIKNHSKGEYLCGVSNIGHGYFEVRITPYDD